MESSNWNRLELETQNPKVWAEMSVLILVILKDNVCLRRHLDSVIVGERIMP